MSGVRISVRELLSAVCSKGGWDLATCRIVMTFLSKAEALKPRLELAHPHEFLG